MTAIGLVDSGADVSIMPKRMADFLDLKSEEAKGMTDFVSASVDVRSATGSLDVVKGNETARLPNVEVRIPMSDEEQPDELILGRFGFFTEFDITFKENARRVELAKVRH